MRKAILWLVVIVILSFIFLGAQEQHSVTVTNVVVPVRVLDKGQFVKDLSLQDFEIMEDNVPQTLEACYLVEQGIIQRTEGQKDFAPSVARNFFVLMQLTQFDPKLEESFRFLFEKVLRPGDSLNIQTMMRNYYISPETLQSKPRDVLAKEMIKQVRKDTVAGNTFYLSLIRELKMIIRSIGGNPMATLDESDSAGTMFGLDMILPRYKETLQKMDEMRTIDEKRILAFASQLRAVQGQKYVFLVYQREFRPELNPGIVNQLMSLYQDEPQILADLHELFQVYRRDVPINIERMRQAFADAQVQFSLIFMHREPQDIQGVTMREQSEDYFRTFSDVALSTGGIVDTSQNLFAGFEHAINAAQSYYLLYYTPSATDRLKGFHNISVRVKDRSCDVFFRKGYFQ